MSYYNLLSTLTIAAIVVSGLISALGFIFALRITLIQADATKNRDVKLHVNDDDTSKLDKKTLAYCKRYGIDPKKVSKKN